MRVPVMYLPGWPFHQVMRLFDEPAFVPRTMSRSRCSSSVVAEPSVASFSLTSLSVRLRTLTVGMWIGGSYGGIVGPVPVPVPDPEPDPEPEPEPEPEPVPVPVDTGTALANSSGRFRGFTLDVSRARRYWPFWGSL